MGSLEEPHILPQEQPLYRKTPLIESRSLSSKLGCKVLLKLESLQPSGSFKSRGISTFIKRSLLSNKNQNQTPHFYSSSGGNAGLACVVAATSLGFPATVVVPLSTKPLMIAKIKAGGAYDVIQHGATWREADGYLRDVLLKKDEGGVYVPPFDHGDIWEGNGSVVDEIVEQVGEEIPKGTNGVSAIVCSVGGGGLMCGIVGALDRCGLSTPVIAVETVGAESLAKAVEAGRLVTLNGITSQATSLGATTVAKQAFEYAIERPKQIKSCVVTDAEAARACCWCADEERIVVELACGASVAICEKDKLRKVMGRELTKDDVIVIVLCGGSNVTVEMLEGWRREYCIEKVIAP